MKGILVDGLVQEAMSGERLIDVINRTGSKIPLVNPTAFRAALCYGLPLPRAHGKINARARRLLHGTAQTGVERYDRNAHR